MYPIYTAVESLWFLANYDNKTQEIIKWSANASMYISAIVLSVFISAAAMPVIFLGFLLSHLLWLFIAHKLCDTALFWQFAFFIPIDLYAMYIRF